MFRFAIDCFLNCAFVPVQHNGPCCLFDGEEFAQRNSFAASDGIFCHSWGCESKVLEHTIQSRVYSFPAEVEGVVGAAAHAPAVLIDLIHDISYMLTGNVCLFPSAAIAAKILAIYECYGADAFDSWNDRM